MSINYLYICGLFYLVFLKASAKKSEPTNKKDEQFRPKTRKMKELYDHLFDDYSSELRPVYNESEALTISVQFWLKQILKIDERDQTLNIYCWLEMYWKDELLKWDPEKYDGVDRIHVPSSKIWKPDILVYNNANMNVEENELETNAIINYDGEVSLFRSMITDITCQLSLKDFPFDQQVCFMTLASWSMDSSKLKLALINGTDNLELYVRNAEWELTGFEAKIYQKQYDCCPHPFVDINYFMVLKRSPSYYIFSLVIPSAFITVVTIVGFFTPHSTTGENTEKVSLGVTALLSMAIIMMMVSDEVPATSEVIPLIGKYYIGLIFLIFLAAFTTTLTLSFQMRGNAGNRMSPRLKYILFEKIAKNPIFSWLFAVQLAHKRNLGRSRNFEPNTFIFENNNTDGVTCKISVTPNGRTKHAKIVQMEDLTGNINKYQIECDSKNCSQYVFLRIYECIETIEQQIIQDHEQTNIKYEWEQATRIIERLIMILYIILTVIFATYMLFGRADDIVLTRDLMDSLKT